METKVTSIVISISHKEEILLRRVIEEVMNQISEGKTSGSDSLYDLNYEFTVDKFNK